MVVLVEIADAADFAEADDGPFVVVPVFVVTALAAGIAVFVFAVFVVDYTNSWASNY